MKVNKLLFIIAVVVVGFIGYYTTELLDDDKKTEAHASWSYVTDSAEGLVEESPLIAVAYVEKTGKESYFPYPEDDTVVFTDAILKIDEVLFSDENLQVGDKITIAQYGGELKDENILTYDDVPLLEKKQKVLVFLEKVTDDTVRSGKYQYVGGNLGLYLLEEDKGLKVAERNTSKVSKSVKALGLEKIQEKAKAKKSN